MLPSIVFRSRRPGAELDCATVFGHGHELDLKVRITARVEPPSLSAHFDESVVITSVTQVARRTKRAHTCHAHPKGVVYELFGVINADGHELAESPSGDQGIFGRIALGNSGGKFLLEGCNFGLCRWQSLHRLALLEGRRERGAQLTQLSERLV